jgi:hypothetical protein
MTLRESLLAVVQSGAERCVGGSAGRFSGFRALAFLSWRGRIGFLQGAWAMQRLGRRVLGALAVTLGLVGALLAAPVATAESDKASRLVTPDHRFNGFTGGELLGEVWYRAYALPVPDNPYVGNGDPCMRLGRTGKVLFNAGVGIPCTIKQGRTVFVNGFFWTCDSVEDGVTGEAAQRACLLQVDDQVETTLVTVDDAEPVKLNTRRYAAFSPQREVQLPPDNIFGVDPQTATFTARGWVAGLKGLRPGLHTIRSENVFTDGSEYVFTKLINVVGHGGSDDDE